MTEVETIAANFRKMGSQFFRCPNNGLIVWAARGDDKALCCCKQQNAADPYKELTTAFGGEIVHRVRYLEPVQAEDYAAQLLKQRPH